MHLAPLFALFALACSGADFSSSGPAGDAGGSTSGGSGGSGTGGAGGSSSGGSGGSSTGGVSGAAAGGSSGAGGGAGVAGAGGSGGTVTACSGDDHAPCASDQFCDALGCGVGVCKQKPAEGAGLNPVCGCDGVTYYNATIAARRRVSVFTAGRCPALTAVTCGEAGGVECDAGLYCSYELSGADKCAVQEKAGICWGLPANCSTANPTASLCDPSCLSVCAAIKTQKTWYDEGC
ncbi:MAG: hypothetical protein KF718_12165 [Polyangiaceae bacterium]|nr:hypothetical protein [Polyangiaceae bacterium]